MKTVTLGFINYGFGILNLYFYLNSTGGNFAPINLGVAIICFLVGTIILIKH